ncbi:MAG: nucleoside triphosphate pyrophosphohydrolase, partial [Flavobacteriia bacterium]|nr:nucleoside triphosphate pyrophosphohydrolase [Flavobacteriia bacterium]
VKLGSNKQEEEFGDLLFSLVNYARFINLSPESALSVTNQKFITRFQWMEEAVANDGKALSDMTLEEMDVYWEQAKQELKGMKS